MWSTKRLMGTSLSLLSFLYLRRSEAGLSTTILRTRLPPNIDAQQQMWEVSQSTRAKSSVRLLLAVNIMTKKCTSTFKLQKSHNLANLRTKLVKLSLSQISRRASHLLGIKYLVAPDQ